MFKLALDAGHGLYTAGKRCLKSIDPKETREWVLNSRICNKLQEKFKEYDGIEVKRMDDVSGKTDVSLAQRCKTANEWGADLYLSIHHNAGINGGAGGGLVVYRYNKLSATGETGKWQKTIYEQLVKAGVPKGNRAEPINSASFAVLKDTKMKAVLIECGFMDSSTDVPIILTEAFADKVVNGCINALVILAGIKKKTIKVETPVVSKPEEPKAEVKTESPKETTENKTTEEDAAPKVETATKPEAAEDESATEKDAEISPKKNWVEVVKDILKLILEWFKIVDTK